LTFFAGEAGSLPQPVVEGGAADIGHDFCGHVAKEDGPVTRATIHEACVVECLGITAAELGADRATRECGAFLHEPLAQAVRWGLNYFWKGHQEVAGT
jgi:hypothetical protein